MRGRKICAMLLGMAVLCSGLPAGMLNVSAEGEAENAGEATENIVMKRTDVTVEDTFAEGLGSEWFDANDGIICENGRLNLSDNNNSAASVKRNVGNGDFAAEIHWSNFRANTDGNNSTMLFRVCDGTENNLVEIQRFSHGQLSLLVKANDKEIVNKTTKTDFNAADGWFKIGYDSATQQISAQYKTSDMEGYEAMTGDGTVVSDFAGKHVVELRAQAWKDSISVDISQLNSTFVKETTYKHQEIADFTAPLGDDWYGSTDGVTCEENGKLVLSNTGEGIAAVKKNIGDQDFSVETQWSEFTGTGTGGIRVSQDGSDQNYVQLMKNADGNIQFTIVQGGSVVVEKAVPYEGAEGWFRIDYNDKTHEVDGYYRADETDSYTVMSGSGTVAEGLAGRHTIELIADDCNVTFNKVDAAYNAKTILESERFRVDIDETTGGVYQLSDPGDRYGTNYVMNPDIRPAFDIDDSRWVGDLVFNVKKASESGYHAANTSLSDDSRNVKKEGDAVTVSYNKPSSHQYGIKDFALKETYQLNETGDQLNWTIDINNTSNEGLEIADLGIPLLMNSWWNTTQDGIYEQNVARHSYVAKDGSYIYWQRPNGDGSFLVMTPQDGTSLEYKDKANSGPFGEKDPSWEGLVEYYIHSAEISKRLPTDYLESTSLSLPAGETKTYGFTFQWAANYTELREILYNAGLVDAVSLPGMVIPKDMTATLAARSQEPISSVTGDTEGITIKEKAAKNGYNIYEITFSKMGPNNVTVHYGKDKESVLQYYATETLENLIQCNTDFLVNSQQAKTDKGYNGAYLQWNMKTGKLITWDDYPGGGWKTWMAGGSDDLGLAPAVYLSEKNITAPQQDQIKSLEYYLENFIWGYMQQHDTYKIYRWYDGKEGTPNDQGTWRSYNYVHIANTYYNMYQIAKRYPQMTNYLKADEYLLRCYNTLKAYFTYSMFDGTPGTDTVNGQGGLGAYKFGNMGEMNLPEIMRALEAEGHTEEQAWLSGRIQEKANNYLFATAYPFASEMSIDTTGFESCYTIAKMYGNSELIEKTTKASLACRGMQPLWYFYGSDNRHMGESWWNLGYETQLGAWQQQDYLYTYADVSGGEFDSMMRGTYGAYLAGWANINVGQISAGQENYGAAAWQYQSEKGTKSKYDYVPNLNGWWAWSGEASLGFWGGLKTASVNIVDDDIVGLYGYGCDLNYADGIYSVTPKDGVRTRLTMYNKDKFHMELSKARYKKAEIADNLQTICLTLENVTGEAYSPEITLNKLPAGEYEVTSGGNVLQSFISDGSQAVVTVELPKDGNQDILIRNKQAETPPTPPTEVNKAELQALYDANQGKQSADYTAESWKAFAEALKEAKAVLDQAESTQKEVNAAYAKLQKAIDALEPYAPTVKADKSRLQACYEEHVGKTPEGYTEKSWGIFAAALANAQKILEKENAAQSEVDAAEIALKSAVAALEPVNPENPDTPDIPIPDGSVVQIPNPGNAMGGSLPNDQELSNVLTEEDKAEVANGAHVKVELEVKDITDSVPPEDESSAEETLAVRNAQEKYPYTIGAYLDLSLFKTLVRPEGEDRTNISDVNGGVIAKPITIQITIPENLRNPNPTAVTRAYKIIRTHRGEDGKLVSDILDTVLNGDVLSFLTDRFSTYALAYNDTPVKDNKPGGGSGGSGSGGSGAGSDQKPGDQKPGDDQKPDGQKPGTPSFDDITNNGSGQPGTGSGQTASNRPGNTPKTGDTADMGILALICILSLLAVMGIIISKVRRRRI